MSADRWSLCPRCELLRARKIQDDQEALDAAYGKVTLDEFDRMRSQLAALQTAKPVEAFREDYEFWGLDEGHVTADYSGSCKECGFKVKFQHAHRFDPRFDPRPEQSGTQQ